MKSVNAYCISKTHKDGDKCYLQDVKCWTTMPTQADFYDDLKEAEEDLKRILESNERAREYYKHTKGVEMEQADYKIEKVTITFDTEDEKEEKKKQDDFNCLIGDSYNPYPTWL